MPRGITLSFSFDFYSGRVKSEKIAVIPTPLEVRMRGPLPAVAEMAAALVDLDPARTLPRIVIPVERRNREREAPVLRLGRVRLHGTRRADVVDPERDRALALRLARQDEIASQRDDLVMAIKGQLQQDIDEVPLFTVQWSLA